MSGMRPCHVVSSEHGVFCERGIYIRFGRLTLTYMVVMNDMIVRISRIEVQSYRILQQLTTGILGGKLPRIICARPTARAIAAKFVPRIRRSQTLGDGAD